MDNPTPGLRSRSRSKTPFLRSTCDHESCTETEEHTHKSGRKTPIKRSTPLKQLTTKTTIETIEEYTTPPAHRTRASLRAEGRSDSTDGPDRVRGHRKEIIQNEINSQYERVSTSTQHYSALDDVTLSPIQQSFNLSHERSRRFGSPATSICSTDSSFAEQALADTSVLLNVNPNNDHLPSRLYKMAGEYWNKYPKTDYTYSHLSKDRVELAPGQVAMPNMSRRSLTQFRLTGPNVSADEVDRLAATSTWTTSTLRKRYSTVESSDDEGLCYEKQQPARRWWLTRLIISIITTVVTSTRDAYRKVVGPPHRYPYTDRRPAKANLLSRTASAAAAPFNWIYIAMKKVVTTTVTTVTETISSNHVGETRAPPSRRRWPWLLLLLLLPVLGYGSHYTYENWDNIAPNLTDFQLDLKEFSNKIAIPNIIPDINITLPNIRQNLPEVTKTYNEYKDIVQNRMGDASDYVKVVADSCYEEIRRFWRGVI